jgi:glycosyltransferase involved in cell wall biosynthesis
MRALVEILSKQFTVKVIALTSKGAEDLPKNYDRGTEIHWIKQRDYSGSNLWMRAIFECYYSYHLVRVARKISSDLQIVSVPSIFLLPLAIRWRGAQVVVADLRDLVWDYLSEKSIFQRGIKAVISRWMLTSLKNYSSIVVTTQSAKEVLSGVLNPQKITCVENGISRERFESVNGFAYHPPESPFRVTCTGNLGACLHLETLLRAVDGLDWLEVQIVGDGNTQLKLETMKSRRGLKNISFYGQKDWGDLRPFYESCHLLYLQVHPSFKTSRPVRLYEYLATGLPILLAGDGECRDFVSEFENITVISPLNPEALRKTLVDLASKPFRRSSKNPAIIAKKYIRQEQCQDYLNLVEQRLSTPMPSKPKKLIKYFP